MSNLELPDDFRDVLVRATPANSARVFAALSAFGAPVGPHGVDTGTFDSEGPAYRVGMKPLCIDVLTKISGVSFDEAENDAVRADIDGRVVRVIGRQALLRNKRAAGRHKDLDDAEWLEHHGRAGD